MEGPPPPLPPPLEGDDFDQQFGTILETMVTLFESSKPQVHESDEPHDVNDNDVETVTQCERRIKDWKHASKQVVDHSREQLRGIALDYKSALTASQRSSNVPSSTDHQRQMEKMFQQTLHTMKLNSELDQQVIELQGELQRLNDELKKEEEDAVQDHLQGLGSEVLKLKLYRDMGFTPVADSRGNFTKMICRSASTQEARTVELDPQVNDFEWCNFLFGMVDGRVFPGTSQ